MKNVHIVLILITITTVGLLLPIESTKAEEPLFTDCYHEFNGVLEHVAYASFSGGGNCPAITASTSKARGIAHKHLPNYEPHQCREVAVREQ